MKLFIPYFTRSEYGPLSPFISILGKKTEFQFQYVMKYFPSTISLSEIGIAIESEHPDMVLAFFDRPEMVKVAYSAYHKGIPIAQAFAGDIAGGAFDDRDRFVISNYADLIFTTGRRQQNRVIVATRWRREVNDLPLVINSGATHYDDMKCTKIDDLPKRYALVLYNRPSLISIDEMMGELEEMAKWLMDNKYGSILWAQPNGDKGSEEIMEFAKRLRYTKVLPQLQRGAFISYVSTASVFVGNSSSLFFEAPYFTTPIKQFGVRNKYREIPDELSPGASACILNNIYKFLERRNGVYKRRTPNGQILQGGIP